MARASTGDIVGGRYRLERQIGEGGMAAVWRAIDETLERPVAVKFLFAADERERDAIAEEFLREAKLAASVRHRNVVQILDFGRHTDGIPFMVMELLEGDSLGDRFDRGEMFELQFIVELLAEALQGLAAVHDAGIVHRDLKPENIFLVKERDGVYPKLIDFGISKSIDPDTGRRSAVTTRDGRVIGTPEYMSPEQARGLADIDRRTDIYSMGVVLYEALAGQAPFESENPGDLLVLVIHGQATELTVHVPEVGHVISGVVAKAMHREREQRYTDATQLRRALIDALAQTIEGYRETRAEPPPMRSRHRAGRSGEKTLEASLVEAVLPVVRGQSPAPPAPRARVAMLAAAFGLLLVAGVTALLVLPARSTEEPPPRFIVVQGSAGADQVDAPAAAAVAAPAAALEEPTAAPSAVELPENAKSSAAARTTRPRSARAPDAATALARAFNRQKKAVVRCFDRFPGDVAEGATLSLRVSLAKAGRVEQVSISPSELGDGRLAACIRAAVHEMRFGSQLEPVAFRVPLTARRTR